MSIDFGEYTAMQEGMRPGPAVDDSSDHAPFEDAVSESTEEQESLDTGALKPEALMQKAPSQSSLEEDLLVDTGESSQNPGVV
jgi:hypothetical protein